MHRTTLHRFLIASAVTVSATLAAQAPVRIKLATLAPERSPWKDALERLGATWTKVTGGRVRLTVYAGTIPSESSAIDRMALGNLEAATLTAGGLADIDQAFNVFGIPFFFQSDEELAYVQEQLSPLFAKRLEAKRYHLINWGNAGWVQLFSKNPIRSLTDLKNAKLYTGEGSPETVQWYTRNGFHAVPLASTEIPKQLKLPTGLINATPSPPVYAVALQFFRDAPYMLEIRVAPLTSATIMTDAAWNKLTPEDRTKMLEAAKETERQIHKDAPGLDADAIKAMKEHGLKVITLDANELKQFHAAAEALLASQRGSLVPADVYDSALHARDAFRSSNRGR